MEVGRGRRGWDPLGARFLDSPRLHWSAPLEDHHRCCASSFLSSTSSSPSSSSLYLCAETINKLNNTWKCFLARTFNKSNHYFSFWSTRILLFFIFRPLVRPSSVTSSTSQLFSIIWWFRPWKPYIFQLQPKILVNIVTPVRQPYSSETAKFTLSCWSIDLVWLLMSGAILISDDRVDVVIVILIIYVDIMSRALPFSAEWALADVFLCCCWCWSFVCW